MQWLKSSSNTGLVSGSSVFMPLIRFITFFELLNLSPSCASSGTIGASTFCRARRLKSMSSNQEWFMMAWMPVSPPPMRSFWSFVSRKDIISLTSSLRRRGNSIVSTSPFAICSSM